MKTDLFDSNLLKWASPQSNLEKKQTTPFRVPIASFSATIKKNPKKKFKIKFKFRNQMTRLVQMPIQDDSEFISAF